MQKLTRVLLVSAFFLLVFSAQTPVAHAQTALTVFAASSLTDAFNEIKASFEQANPGVTVAYNFGASNTLVTQLSQGAPADVFASANATQMNAAIKANRIAGAPVTFARNRLVLIVPADNPAKITTLQDLAKPGIKLVVAAQGVPVRDYTDTMLDKLAQNAAYGSDYKNAFLKNVVSEEANVRQ